MERVFLQAHSIGDLITGDSLAITSVLHNLGPHGPGIVLVNVSDAHKCRTTDARDIAAKLSIASIEHSRGALKQAGIGSDVSLKPHMPRHTWSGSYQFDSGQSPSGHRESELRSGCDELASDLMAAARAVACAADIGLGLQQARSRECWDAIVGAWPPRGTLESVMVASQSAKVRLIHYHSADDTARLSSRPAAAAVQACLAKSQAPSSSGVKSTGDLRDIADWQGWHFDYGLFTALASPKYAVRQPDGSLFDVCEKIAGGDVDAGLVVLRRVRADSTTPTPADPSAIELDDPDAARYFEPVLVHIPPGCVAVQAGEAAQILTGGRIVSPLHCVMRPRWRIVAPLPGAAGGSGLKTVSRSTCVLFTQPHWSERMEPLRELSRLDQDADACEQTTAASADVDRLDLTPPLAGRWRAGMEFSEFSRAVTQAYYGGRSRAM